MGTAIGLEGVLSCRIAGRVGIDYSFVRFEKWERVARSEWLLQMFDTSFRRPLFLY